MFSTIRNIAIQLDRLLNLGAQPSGPVYATAMLPLCRIHEKVANTVWHGYSL